MTSITEDPTLPLDLDGTSNQLSGGSSQYGGHLDSTLPDASSSSEMEQPGTFRNLTSAGRVSPHRTRTMKDQETQLAEYKKENFGLKLRIYHLEQALGKDWEDDDGWKLNIELQVQLASLKKELSEKDALLLQAKSAIDSMADQHEAHIQQLQQQTSQPTQTEMEELRELEDRVADREAELAEAERELEESNARLGELQAANDDLGADLQEKDDKLGRMQREVDDLRQAIAERDAAEKVVPPPTPTRSASVQTTEPLAARLESTQAQLAAAQAQLQDQEKAIVELQAAVGGKDRRVKELEVELLVSSQKMAAGASDYATQMQDQAAQLDRCKANLREAEAKARQRGAELEELGRQLEQARRRAGEAEGVAGDLQPRLERKDREIEDLRRQLQDAQTQAQEDGQAREREIQGLRRRLRDAEALAEQSQPQLAAKHREIQELDHSLQEKNEEISRLRSQLKEKDEALARARKSTHTANMEKQEQSAALQRLQEELAGLREQLRQQRSGAQADLEAALAAKDAIINQLRRELRDQQDKLDEIDEKLLELTTSKSAELGVLRGELEDLSKQLERQEGLVRALRSKVTQLQGEKAGLEQQLQELAEANQELQEQLEALRGELASKAQNLQQAEQTIANLQKIIADLQKTQPQMSELEKSAAELAQLRSQMAALEHALRNKEAEADSLLQTLQLKDNTIRELQAQLQRLRGEKARAEERGRELEGEKNELEAEVARLQSQARVSRLSSDDLQDKLTQAFGEREELARRLKQAQEALKEKGSAYDQARAACEALQEQIKQLQQQLEELGQQKGGADASDGASVTVTHHETSTETGQPSASAQPQQPPGSSSTTMIFSSLSESLLLTILQRLQELYAETTAGRADSNVARSSMSTKLEHITDLQHRLQSVLQGNKPPESKPPSANTSYTAYYFMRGEDESSGSEASPKKSSTPKMRRSPRHTPRHTPRMSPDLGAGTPRDASQQIAALQSELEEVKRWNEALQARLNQSSGTRDVGVGMEKDGEPPIPTAAVPHAAGFVPERYLELEREVDRLLCELEAEKERSQVEKEQQERGFAELQAKLEEAEEEVGSLEQQLRSAMSRDAATSADALAAESLREEVERLGRELGEARATVAGLKGRIQAESDDNRRLRAELAELRSVSVGTMTTPLMETKSTLATSESLPAMPTLLTPERTPVVVADSWTSPPHGVPAGVGAGGEPADVRALRERHEEVTRLNQELQRKCREQLKRSPPQSRPGSGGQSTLHWQAKLREQEEALRSEMLERERGLLGQLRESEARLIEREGEWRARESALHQQLADLEVRLGESQKSGEGLRSKLAEALATCRSKDEEILNLSQSLSRAREKVEALEQQIDQLLAEKNAAIRGLESQVRMLEKELLLANEKAQRLSEALQVLGSARGKGEGEGEGDSGEEDEEMGTLQEAIDSLSQQLTSALEELEDFKRHNMGLEEERDLLSDQLAGCQDQIRTLQEELILYQNLLQDSVKEQSSTAAAGTQAGGGDLPGASPGKPGLSLTAEKVLQLLEEVRKLREQLDSSIRSNNLLAEQLRSRLAEQEASHATTSTSETHISISRASPASKTKGSQTTPRSPRTYARGREGQSGSARKAADKGTSPSYIHVSEKSTGTQVPTSEKGTGTHHVPPTDHTKSSSSTFRSERASTHYHHRDAARPPAPHGGSPLGGSLSYTDVHLSDSSTSSFSHPPSTSKPKAGETVSTSGTTFTTFTLPKDTSTPHTRGGASARSTSSREHFTSAASDAQKGSQSRLFSDGIHGDRVTRVTYHSRGVNTDIPKRSSSDEFLTKGPTLDSSSASSFYSRTTTTRLHEGEPSTGDLGASSSSHAWRRPASTGSHGATPGVPPTSHATPLSSLLHGAGGFESLETRLQQALDSSTLPASDRAFLEELLVYLRQQRRQLDESRRLLERLERQQQRQAGVPSTSHIRVETAESGTIPVVTTTSYTTRVSPARPSSGTAAAATGQEAKAGVGARPQGTKVDLSSLYEQLLRTHASLVEAKSTLNHSKTQ